MYWHERPTRDKLGLTPLTRDQQKTLYINEQEN